MAQACVGRLVGMGHVRSAADQEEGGELIRGVRRPHESDALFCQTRSGEHISLGAGMTRRLESLYLIALEVMMGETPLLSRISFICWTGNAGRYVEMMMGVRRRGAHAKSSAHRGSSILFFCTGDSIDFWTAVG